LNLTVFNVRDPQAIWNGIRNVWASPFSERSYRWRQRLLLNPENVYPSILIIPSVNNDKSGVLITTGVFSGDPQDLTMAFNRGSGGAVEGQVAESYTIKNDSIAYLLSPCRELRYTSQLVEGGIEKPIASLDQPVLNQIDLSNIYQFANIIKSQFQEKKGFQASSPLDIELGIKDGKIWLFQVRPFVESKKVRSADYLNQMDQSIILNANILLDENIENLRH
jgi:phosphoenolpyruvate synthase/pyruvate phosphate dikinase